MRAVERERRDLDFKALAIKRDHPVGAGHESGRGGQRNAAGVFERRSGLQHWFLANDAGTSHFLPLPDAVGDDPMACLELDRCIPSVCDLDRVGPEVTARYMGILVHKTSKWSGIRCRQSTKCVDLRQPSHGGLILWSYCAESAGPLCD